MAKAFKIKYRDGFGVRFMKWVVRLFKRRPEIIDLNGCDIPAGSIIIANHSAASGPMTYRTFLTPPMMMIWGAHQMCGGYFRRRRYLVRVFYGQKLGYGKLKAWICGTAFAIVSGWFYRSAGIIPVYYDNKVKQTFANSLACLKENVSVLVFPENSSGGYKDTLEEPMFGGYITLAKMSAKLDGGERPVYTMHYSKKNNRIVIGKPHYVGELLKTMTKDEVNEYFRLYLNSLPELASSALQEGMDKSKHNK